MSKTLKRGPKSNKSPNLVTLIKSTTLLWNNALWLINTSQMTFYKIESGSAAVMIIILKNRAKTASFCVISYLSQCNYKYNAKFEYQWKKCRWCAWNLTLGLQDGRFRRSHYAIVAGPIVFIHILSVPSTYLSTLVRISLEPLFFVLPFGYTTTWVPIATTICRLSTNPNTI